MDLNEKKKKELEVENKLAYVLAETYLRIPWSKLRIKSAHTFFVDRVRASSTNIDFNTFLDALLKKIQVPFVKIDKEILDFLNQNNSYVMSVLRKESVYIVNFALETVEYIKEQRKLDKTGQKTL